MNLQEVMYIEDIIETMSEGDEVAKGIFHLIGRENASHQEKFEVGMFSAMDLLGIRGHRLVVFWDNVCKKDIVHMIAILQAYRRGEWPAEKIKQDIDQV